MRLNSTIIIPLLVLVFAAIGFEQLALPYVSFGAGRWSDSLGTNVSNRKARINGDLNITGNYYQNGALFTGGGGAGINWDTVLTRTADSARLGWLARTQTWTGANTFDGDISAGDVSISDTLLAIGFTQINELLTLYGVQFGDETHRIAPGGSDIEYTTATGGAHIFQTQSGTQLAKIDSSSGMGSRIKGVNSFWGGTKMIYEKLVALKAGNSNSTVTATHGLNHNNILGWKCEIRDDTTNTHVSPGSWYSPWVFYAKIDSLTVTITIPASPSGYSVANDSAYFLIRYFQ